MGEERSEAVFVVYSFVWNSFFSSGRFFSESRFSISDRLSLLFFLERFFRTKGRWFRMGTFSFAVFVIGILVTWFRMRCFENRFEIFEDISFFLVRGSFFI